MEDIAIAAIIRSAIPKTVMLDHAEMPSAARKVAAAKARELGLSGRDARRSTGFNAHLVMENNLKEICENAGGIVIDDRMFPGTELTLYQPLSRYGRVLLGRATIQERRGLPSANVTRRNGSTLNACLQSDLFTVKTNQNAPFHVLLLTLADSHELEVIAATYIAVLAPSFDSFLFIEEIDDFIGGYNEAEEVAGIGGAVEAVDFGLVARKDVKPFAGEEHQSEDVEKKS